MTQVLNTKVELSLLTIESFERNVALTKPGHVMLAQTFNATI